MKITVNLDSQTVITQPSPLRFKAGCFNPVEIGFTRNSQSVPLPDGTVIEFALKPRNQWTGGLLAYLNSFEVTAGNIYTGTLNCSTTALLSALGLCDQVQVNDVAQLDASAEVTWSIGGQKFRSGTFSATVEPPLTDDNPIPSPDPTPYPPPDQIALKSDIPSLPALGTAASLDAGIPNGVATLGPDGKVLPGQLPAIPEGTSIKLIPVADTAERLALRAAQVGVGDLVEQMDSRAVFEVLDTALLAQESGYVQIGTRPAGAATSLTNGLIAFWNLDEESGARMDATGNGLDLSDINGATCVPGVIGNAAYSDGTQSLGSGHDFALRNLPNYSVLAWFKATSAVAILNDYADGWGLYTEAFSGNTGVCFWGSDQGNISIEYSSALEDDAWHQIGLVRQGDLFTLYIDGAAAGSTNLTPGTPFPIDVLNLLGNYDGNDRGPCAVDLTGVWGRSLSDAEIAQLYNNGNGLAYPFA